MNHCNCLYKMGISNSTQSTTLTEQLEFIRGEEQTSMEKTMLFDSLFCSRDSFLRFFNFHEKSNRGHPFVSSKRLLTFLFFGTGSRRSKRKTKRERKKKGKPIVL